MKNFAWLRRKIKNYLKHPRSPSQNDCARRWKMSPSTLSELLRGKHNGLTSEQEALILDTIVAWERDPVIVAGKIKERLMRQYFTQLQINEIASFMIVVKDDIKT